MEYLINANKNVAVPDQEAAVVANADLAFTIAADITAPIFENAVLETFASKDSFQNTELQLQILIRWIEMNN